MDTAQASPVLAGREGPRRRSPSSRRAVAASRVRGMRGAGSGLRVSTPARAHCSRRAAAVSPRASPRWPGGAGPPSLAAVFALGREDRGPRVLSRPWSGCCDAHARAGPARGFLSGQSPEEAAPVPADQAAGTPVQGPGRFGSGVGDQQLRTHPGQAQASRTGGAWPAASRHQDACRSQAPPQRPSAADGSRLRPGPASALAGTGGVNQWLQAAGVLSPSRERGLRRPRPAPRAATPALRAAPLAPTRPSPRAAGWQDDHRSQCEC